MTARRRCLPAAGTAFPCEHVATALTSAGGTRSVCGMIDRRLFLKHLLGASCASTLGCQTSDAPGAWLERVPWGEAPPDKAHALLPADRRPDGVLDVFLMGGLSAWDTFYLVPEHGDPVRGGPFAGQQWWNFHDGVYSPVQAFSECGGGQRPIYEPFGLDAAGKTVNLGPWVYPLRDRQDIVQRMRIVVMSHGSQPHNAAVPLAMTGHSRGSARQATTASHVQRHLIGKNTGRLTPWTYTLYPDNENVAGFNVEAASSIGMHRSAARPLTVRIRPGSRLAEQLKRVTVGDHASALDGALAHYTRRFRERLAGGSGPLLSPAMADYEQAMTDKANAVHLAGRITAADFEPLTGSLCGYTNPWDGSRMGLELAARLLTEPNEPASYVNVIDSGLSTDGFGAYDTHHHHVRDTSRSTTHFCRQLAAVINEPGEGDPRSL